MTCPTATIELLALLALADSTEVTGPARHEVPGAAPVSALAPEVPGALGQTAPRAAEVEWLRAAGEPWKLSLHSTALAVPLSAGSEPTGIRFGSAARADSAGSGASPPESGEAPGELPGKGRAAAFGPSPPSATTALLVMEGFFVAYSCIGYAKDGGQILGGFNSLCALLAIGGAVVDPKPDLTVEGQLALGAAWLALGAFQFDQHDRGAPKSQVVIGNLVGVHAMSVLAAGVDWAARRLHGEPKKLGADPGSAP